jgi:Zn-dependent M28 family amino/carboxypeptidase
VAADGSRGAWLAVAVLGVVGAVPVMASVVQARSPGALDNASGVAAVLLAAELLAVEARRAGPHGVLVTSAEELGLAGARAWARAWRASGRAAGVAVNCDGVDDAGALTCMYTGAAPRELVAALGRAAHGVRVRRLVPGILVDAVALADAGWETLTVSKGTVRTLARIHTPADTRGALTGRGVAEAAAVMRAAVAVIAARRARPAGAGGRRG